MFLSNLGVHFYTANWSFVTVLNIQNVYSCVSGNNYLYITRYSGGIIKTSLTSTAILANTTVGKYRSIYYDSMDFTVTWGMKR